MTQHTSPPGAMPSPAAQPVPKPAVGGWLLLLCAVLVVVGPLVSLALVAEHLVAAWRQPAGGLCLARLLVGG